MPVEFEGAEELADMLAIMGAEARGIAMKALMGVGTKVHDLAVRMAPVDDGNLEDSIKIDPVEGDGSVASMSVTIYVDTAMDVPERPGKTVGDYAFEINEHMEPVGYLQRGPLSEAKQDSTGVVVGGAFLERALDQVTDTDLTQATLDGIAIKIASTAG